LKYISLDQLEAEADIDVDVENALSLINAQGKF